MTVVARLPRKRVLVATLGQSLTVGHVQDQTGTIDWPYSAKYAACSDPVLPNGGDEGSAWPSFCDYMAAIDIAVSIKNTARGGTGLIEDWLGDTSGLGTGTPYASGDPGFDPNGYIQDVLDEMNTNAVYDERWAFIAFAKKDGDNNVTRENWSLALQNITDVLLDNDINVAIGLSGAGASIESWLITAGYPGRLDALHYYLNDARVIAGGNLAEAMGASYTDYLQNDDVHLIPAGSELMSETWFNAVNDTAFTA